MNTGDSQDTGSIFTGTPDASSVNSFPVSETSRKIAIESMQTNLEKKKQQYALDQASFEVRAEELRREMDRLSLAIAEHQGYTIGDGTASVAPSFNH